MATTPEVKIFSDAVKLVKSVAGEILSMIHSSSQPRFDIALSGGKTPGLLFDKLAEAGLSGIDLNRIHFWWGDERCVPPGDPESNFHLANTRFLSRVAIPEKNIHRLRGEAEPVEEAERYSEEIRANLNSRGQWPVFDLILLGLGEDGHTASIFPGNLTLMNSNKICEVSSHPLTGQQRITLTGNVINNANRVFFVVTGQNKAGRIHEIMNNEQVAKSFPAYHVAPLSGTLIWFLDNNAASLIS